MVSLLNVVEKYTKHFFSFNDITFTELKCLLSFYVGTFIGYQFKVEISCFMFYEKPRN